MFKFIIFILLVASATAAYINLGSEVNLKSTLGVVTPVVRCGGVGTPIQLRVSDCDGRCQLTPGTRYDIEGDLITSSAAPSLSLRVQLIHFMGDEFTIVDTVLENSSVQPGMIYTVRYSMVPNDILSGQSVFLRATLYHTDNELVEMCISAEVDIL